MAVLAILFAREPLLLPGLVLVAAGAALRLWAAGNIVKSETLTRSGPYAYTRNPLYLGSFLSGLGVFVLIHNWWLLAIFLGGFGLFYGSTIRGEEDYLSGKYGEEFAAYRKHVPAFLPRILPHRSSQQAGFSWQRAVENREYTSLGCTIAVTALILFVAYLR
jgi:protein-S-isoprenylcysteine O-methyltransferase Ste14